MVPYIHTYIVQATISAHMPTSAHMPIAAILLLASSKASLQLNLSCHLL